MHTLLIAPYSDDRQSDSSDGESLGLSDEEESVSSGDQVVHIEARAKAMATLVPPLPASEYGVMPPKHSRSQLVASKHGMLDSDNINMDSESPRPTRRPIFQRDKFDGVDSDDESDPDDNMEFTLAQESSEEDEDLPTIVGEIEVDMDAEKEEFIRFTRDILGIDAKQWEDIVKDRQKRGGMSGCHH